MKRLDFVLALSAKSLDLRQEFMVFVSQFLAMTKVKFPVPQ